MVTKGVFRYLFKPEKLPQHAKKLQSLSLNDKFLWLQSRDMLVGMAAKRIVAKISDNDSIMNQVTASRKTCRLLILVQGDTMLYSCYSRIHPGSAYKND